MVANRRMMEETLNQLQEFQERIHTDDIYSELQSTGHWFDVTARSYNQFLSSFEGKAQVSNNRNDLDASDSDPEPSVDETPTLDDDDDDEVAADGLPDNTFATFDKTKEIDSLWNSINRAKEVYQAEMNSALKQVQDGINGEIQDLAARSKSLDDYIRSYLRQKADLEKFIEMEEDIKKVCTLTYSFAHQTTHYSILVKVIDNKFRVPIAQMTEYISCNNEELTGLEKKLILLQKDILRIEGMTAELSHKRKHADPVTRTRAKHLVCSLLESLHQKELEVANELQSKIDAENDKIANAQRQYDDALKYKESLCESVIECKELISNKKSFMQRERGELREKIYELKAKTEAMDVVLKKLEDVLDEGRRIVRRKEYLEKKKELLKSSFSRSFKAQLQNDVVAPSAIITKVNTDIDRDVVADLPSNDDHDEGDDLESIRRAMLSSFLVSIAHPVKEELLWPNPAPSVVAKKVIEDTKTQPSVSFAKNQPTVTVAKVVSHQVDHGPPITVFRSARSAVCAAVYGYKEAPHHNEGRSPVKNKKNGRRGNIMNKKRYHTLAKSSIGYFRSMNFHIHPVLKAIENSLHELATLQCVNSKHVSSYLKAAKQLHKECSMLMIGGHSLVDIEVSTRSLCVAIIHKIYEEAPLVLLVQNKSDLLARVLIIILTLLGVIQNSTNTSWEHGLHGTLTNAQEDAMDSLCLETISLVLGNHRKGILIASDFMANVRALTLQFISQNNQNYQVDVKSFNFVETILNRLMHLNIDYDLFSSVSDIRTAIVSELRKEAEISDAVDTRDSHHNFEYSMEFTDAHYRALEAYEILLVQSTAVQGLSNLDVAEEKDIGKILAKFQVMESKFSQNITVNDPAHVVKGEENLLDGICRGLYLSEKKVKSSFVVVEDPIATTNNLESLLQLVHPKLIGAILTLDLFKRVMHVELSRIKFLGEIATGKEEYNDLQYLNVQLPDDMIQSSKGYHEDAIIGANRPQEPLPLITEPKVDNEDVNTSAMKGFHKMFIDDLGRLFNKQVNDLYAIITGPSSHDSMSVVSSTRGVLTRNLTSEMKDRLMLHIEKLFAATSSRSATSKIEVYSTTKDYENLLLSLKEGQVALNMVLSALLTPFKNKYKLMQKQVQYLKQERVLRREELLALRNKSSQVQDQAEFLKKEYKSFRKTKTASEEVVKMFNLDCSDGVFEALERELTQLQERVRQLQAQIKSKHSDYSHLQSQEKLLRAMTILTKEREETKNRGGSDTAAVAVLLAQTFEFEDGDKSKDVEEDKKAHAKKELANAAKAVNVINALKANLVKSEDKAADKEPEKSPAMAGFVGKWKAKLSVLGPQYTTNFLTDTIRGAPVDSPSTTVGSKKASSSALASSDDPGDFLFTVGGPDYVQSEGKAKNRSSAFDLNAPSLTSLSKNNSVSDTIVSIITGLSMDSIPLPTIEAPQLDSVPPGIEMTDSTNTVVMLLPDTESPDSSSAIVVPPSDATESSNKCITPTTAQSETTEPNSAFLAELPVGVIPMQIHINISKRDACKEEEDLDRTSIDFDKYSSEFSLEDSSHTSDSRTIERVMSTNTGIKSDANGPIDSSIGTGTIAGVLQQYQAKRFGIVSTFIPKKSHYMSYPKKHMSSSGQNRVIVADFMQRESEAQMNFLLQDQNDKTNFESEIINAFAKLNNDIDSSVSVAETQMNTILKSITDTNRAAHPPSATRPSKESIRRQNKL